MRRRQVLGRGDMNGLDAAGHLQAQSVAIDRLHMRGAADQGDAVPCARQHGAVITADGACANDRNRIEPMGHKGFSEGQ